MAESKTGEIVCLNLPAKLIDPPFFDREKFVHKIKVDKHGRFVRDDTYELNTQSQTQIDGFLHFAHQTSQRWYNDTTGDDIDNQKKSGMAAWAKHGIAGRGILLDFFGWAESRNFPVYPFAEQAITLQQLHDVAKSQGIDLRPESEGGDVRVGDLLLIRSGFVKDYHGMSLGEREKMARRAPPENYFIGLDRAQDMLTFLHDSYFAAVMGDQPALEVWPPSAGSMHDHALALWGIPLGELWDLDELAEKCKERKNWKVFITSAPFNVQGGIASWANALAIL